MFGDFPTRSRSRYTILTMVAVFMPKGMIIRGHLVLRTSSNKKVVAHQTIIITILYRQYCRANEISTPPPMHLDLEGRARSGCMPAPSWVFSVPGSNNASQALALFKKHCICFGFFHYTPRVHCLFDLTRR